jgi:hypothetical protein
MQTNLMTGWNTNIFPNASISSPNFGTNSTMVSYIYSNSSNVIDTVVLVLRENGVELTEDQREILANDIMTNGNNIDSFVRGMLLAFKSLGVVSADVKTAFTSGLEQGKLLGFEEGRQVEHYEIQSEIEMRVSQDAYNRGLNDGIERGKTMLKESLELE